MRILCYVSGHGFGHAARVCEVLRAVRALRPDVELVIYRVAQESLTNALRHSGAREATVSVTADAESVTLTVTDDGKGLPTKLPRDSSGVAGMRERALLVGGMLSLASAPGQGTEVRLTIPIDEERA